MNGTIEEKRVAVARDALAMFRADKFRIFNDSSVSEFLRWIDGIPCGCAIGILCCAMQNLGIPVNGLSVHRIGALWNYDSADSIEEAFEWDWGSRFSDRSDRLIAILQNIIRNSGTFVPADIRPIEVDSPTIPTLDFHRDLTADRALSPAETRWLVTD